MMKESLYPQISMEEAWQRVAAVVKPLPPIVLPLRAVLGHVLAEDVVATESMPPFRCSAMDGYAVIASDTSSELRVIGEQGAGQTGTFYVELGTAVRIMTGAPLPKGANAVVPIENTAHDEEVVRLLSPVSAGENVRPIGQDLLEGDLVLESGQAVGPPEIGLLAGMGRSRVRVHPKPTVAVMATGDELVPPDATPGPGQIRDSNGPALLAAVEAIGYRVEHLGLVADDETTLRQAILNGVSCADMLISSGGVSVGARDLVKPLLEELGTVHFGRVAIKPGKPLTFAVVRDIPVFGLPGYPVSSLVAFENFVRPALRIMAGHHKLWRPEIRVRLSCTIRHAPDRTEYQRALVTVRNGAYWAETTGSQVSGRLKSLVGANALLVLPAGTSHFSVGDQVVAILIDQPEVGRDQ